VRRRGHIVLTLVVMGLAIGLFLWQEHRISGTFGFPLDDAWIHAQFARNLARPRVIPPPANPAGP